jgi:hypothetical protein
MLWRSSSPIHGRGGKSEAVIEHSIRSATFPALCKLEIFVAWDIVCTLCHVDRFCNTEALALHDRRRFPGTRGQETEHLP